MREDLLKANAELTIQLLAPLSGIDFGYNAESVEWVQGYIDRLRERGQLEDKQDKLVSILGSFLGECIVHCHGGRWIEDEENGVGVIVGDFTAFPFNKIRKQMDNGLDDGIAGFFECIPLIARRHEIGIDLRPPERRQTDFI